METPRPPGPASPRAVGEQGVSGGPRAPPQSPAGPGQPVQRVGLRPSVVVSGYGLGGYSSAKTGRSFATGAGLLYLTALSLVAAVLWILPGQVGAAVN